MNVGDASTVKSAFVRNSRFTGWVTTEESDSEVRNSSPHPPDRLPRLKRTQEESLREKTHVLKVVKSLDFASDDIVARELFTITVSNCVYFLSLPDDFQTGMKEGNVFSV